MPDEHTTDPAKDKFREALERKRGQQHSSAAAHNESKVHDRHDKAGAKRSFRRKSG